MLATKKTVTLFILSCLATIGNATVAQIQADLQTVDNDFKSLTSATNSYSGSSSEAQRFQQAYDKLENDLKQGAQDSQATTATSSSNCRTLVTYVNSPLEPDINAFIHALINKKSLVESGSITNTICSRLRQLKSETDNFLSFLKNCSGGQPAIDKVDADFQALLDAYNCLPLP